MTHRRGRQNPLSITPTADMTLVKVLLNSIISTENTRCVILDVKDFYLNTPMKRFKYMRLKLNKITEEFIIKYKLGEIAIEDGYVYCEIQKECTAYLKQE